MSKAKTKQKKRKKASSGATKATKSPIKGQRAVGGEPPKPRPVKVIAVNRKARHEYHIFEEIEAGIVLTGTEVKSLRQGKIQLRDSYASEHRGEFFLHNCHISPYTHGNIQNHEPERLRKLLLRKGEIKKLYGKIREKGQTLVPLKVYFRGPYVKVVLGLAKGKKLYDKRASLKEREHKREMARGLRNSFKKTPS